jgi:peptide/nickel transport system permease protein
MRFLPGDVVQVMLGTEAQLAPEQRETLYRLLGLDAPVHVQYLRWLGAALTGDLGVSLRTAEPVARLIGQRLPVTLELACLATALAWLVAVPLGTLAALRRNRGWDGLAHLVGLVGLSLPMLLPVLSLAAALVAVVMRMTRSSMLEVLGQDYIRTARAKGVDETRVVTRHAFTNAAIPVVTVMGLQVGYLLGGAVVVESIFGLPGLGWVILQGIYQRDYPVVQGAVLFVAVVFVLVNLAVDLGYAWLDPRIRYE